MIQVSRFQKPKNTAMKGTPLPFGHQLGEGSDDSDSDLSDGSMTEVTVEVMSPLSDEEEDEEPRLQYENGEICATSTVYRLSLPGSHGEVYSFSAVNGDNNGDAEENDDIGAITPFTETTVNLPDMPITPEQEDEKPTFDNVRAKRRY